MSSLSSIPQGQYHHPLTSSTSASRCTSALPSSTRWEESLSYMAPISDGISCTSLSRVSKDHTPHVPHIDVCNILYHTSYMISCMLPLTSLSLSPILCVR